MQCKKIILTSTLISSVYLFQQCKNTITHQINLSLAVNNKDQPAISDPVVSLSSDHKDECAQDDFFWALQWKSICNGFACARRMEPKSEFSNIIISPIPGLN
ncbi:MAG: hypothetical protein WCI49_13630 [Ferruginibacter sp.]